MEAAWPESDEIDENLEIRWKPQAAEGEDAPADALVLPRAFDQALFDVDDRGRSIVRLTLAEAPPRGWALYPEDETDVFFDEVRWEAMGRPLSFSLAWEPSRPPSGFSVRWKGADAAAWWPVNVAGAEALPPPEDLKHLPLEVLIDVLTSARPLHRALAAWLKRRGRRETETSSGERDPHKRVDTSQFLLQRTRRISYALAGLRERLSRPVATVEGLRWRLHGPVGPKALADALGREGRTPQEKAFLMAELALELARVRPQKAPGCLKPEEVLAGIAEVIKDLRSKVPLERLADHPELRAYVERAFEEAAV